MKILLGVLLWLLSVPLNLLMLVFTYIFAQIIVLFCNSEGYLPKYLSWFQTPDNSMDGDKGWKTEHWQWRYKFPKPLSIYIGRIGWCWRNPAYGFDIDVIGAKSPPEPFKWYGNRNITDSQPTIDGWLFVTSGIYWNLYIIQPFFGRTLRIYLGWKLRNGEGRNPYQLVCYINPFKHRA